MRKPKNPILKKIEFPGPRGRERTIPLNHIYGADITAADIAPTMDNPKKFYGDKKPRLSFLPMNIMLSVAEVMYSGAVKYGKKNWRVQPVEAATYYDAAYRHMIAWFEDRVDLDPESGKHHLDHAIASLLIIRDGIERGELIDNRAQHEVITAGCGT